MESLDDSWTLISSGSRWRTPPAATSEAQLLHLTLDVNKYEKDEEGVRLDPLFKDPMVSSALRTARGSYWVHAFPEDSYG